MSNKDELLSNALGELGGIGSKWVAKFLPNDAYELSLDIAIQSDSIITISTNVLSDNGKILSTESAFGITSIKGLTGSGFFNMNPTLVTISIAEASPNQVRVLIQGIAKEGLIKQHAGKKAAQRIAQQLSAKLDELSRLANRLKP